MAEVKFVFPADRAAPMQVVWPCKFDVPLNGGTHETQQVDVRFNVIGQDETAKAYRGADAGLYDAVVDGFPTLTNAKGEKVPDVDAKALFRTMPFAVIGILDGYFEMLKKRLPKN